jgi:hypothetical protein
MTFKTLLPNMHGKLHDVYNSQLLVVFTLKFVTSNVHGTCANLGANFITVMYFSE